MTKKIEKLLIFDVCGQMFSLDAADVGEILSNVSISALNTEEKSTLGISVVRNEPLVVIDMALSFGKSSPDNSMFIVVHANDAKYVIKVGLVKNILDVSTGKLLDTPENMKKTCVNRFFMHDNEIINVINVDKFIAKTAGRNDIKKVLSNNQHTSIAA